MARDSGSIFTWVVVAPSKPSYLGVGIKPSMIRQVSRLVYLYILSNYYYYYSRVEGIESKEALEGPRYPSDLGAS